ncbi:hypothetical protein [uncultured Tateyamaria sp.]|uniref:hypothetical protein n=1 Tax=uncultured Tateyamaria sp. TaxID=455651 RepID=UPI00261E8A70|nr:hypothetical protein [uncultured Tateyamaria sp.]
MTYTLIPGQSHEASEEETMSMIRSLLTEDVAAPAKPAPAKAQATKPEEAPQAFVSRSVGDAPRRRATDLPDLQDNAETAPRKRRLALPNVTGIIRARLAHLRAFRPSTRHLAMVSTLLLLVVRPHWFVIGLVLTIAVVTGAFMTLGADRIWRGVLNWLDRVAARDPARAQQLRVRLDRFACRWDGVLDMFPDGMVDGLYMPDFQGMQDAEAAHIAAMGHRLDRMVQEG